MLEKLENLERYVKTVDEKFSTLQAKVDCFESFKNKTEKRDQRTGRRIGFCEHGTPVFQGEI